MKINLYWDILRLILYDEILKGEDAIFLWEKLKYG